MVLKNLSTPALVQRRSAEPPRGIISARTLRVLGVSALMCWFFLARLSTAADALKTPVLVELFTSEGCSSCPRADELLAQLERSQPVAGVQIIALGEHVDYWNGLGWRDPFSSPRFTARQNQYSRIFRNDNIYTPQMIVDGKIEFIGNDAARAQHEIANAARSAKVPVQLTMREVEGKAGSVAISIRVDNCPASAEVLLAVTETGIYSDVLNGENKGRKLHHTAVVRWMSVVGRVKPKQSFSAEPLVEIQKTWNGENLHAVAFAADRSQQRVLGAAEISLNRAAATAAGN